jgi:CRISPR system Cascade subunit CasC
MKTLIEIHALQNFAPSNLNRDDTGAPKDAWFGGTRRARISSQCLKRAVRQHFEEQKKMCFFQDSELAIRTKRILGRLSTLLIEKHGRDETEARKKITLAMNSMGFVFKENEKTEYLMFLGETEIAKIADIVHEKWNEIGDSSARLSGVKSDISKALYGAEPDDRKMQAIFRTLEIDNDAKKISDEKITAIENNLDEIIIALRDVLDVVNPIPLDETSAGKAKPKKRKKSEQEDWEKKIDGILKDGKKGLSALGKALAKIMDGGKAVDLALFGRMLADMPERNQNAACQVAHAISTHAVEREFDFYTAVDDLKPEDTAGADMMGTVEFNSACFYRYAVVDWEKLNENLQGDVELAKKGLKAFLEGFVMAEPTGKQNTFAAHNPPEFVAVSVRSNTAPRNLANAFETAIRVRKDESITKESATKLIEKAKALAAAFDAKNANRQTHILNLVEANTTGFGTNVESMVDLLTKVLENVKNGKG